LAWKRTEIQHKFDEIVAFAEVEQFLDTPVKRYSSGMYVRPGPLLWPAHLEPEILVVDEVLAVGDAKFQEKCLGRMNALAGSGRTVLSSATTLVQSSSYAPRHYFLSRPR
jgi:lipopolysaccharide transport system ATP-binding protein